MPSLTEKSHRLFMCDLFTLESSCRRIHVGVRFHLGFRSFTRVFISFISFDQFGVVTVAFWKTIWSTCTWKSKTNKKIKHGSFLFVNCHLHLEQRLIRTSISDISYLSLHRSCDSVLKYFILPLFLRLHVEKFILELNFTLESNFILESDFTLKSFTSQNLNTSEVFTLELLHCGAFKHSSNQNCGGTYRKSNWQSGAQPFLKKNRKQGISVNILRCCLYLEERITSRYSLVIFCIGDVVLKNSYWSQISSSGVRFNIENFEGIVSKVYTCESLPLILVFVYIVHIVNNKSLRGKKSL